MSEIYDLLKIINNPSDNLRTSSELEKAMVLLKKLCISKSDVTITTDSRTRCVDCNKSISAKNMTQLPCKCLQTYHTKCLINRIIDTNIKKNMDNLEIECLICKRNCKSDEIKEILGKEHNQTLIDEVKTRFFECSVCLEKKLIEDSCITLSCEHRTCDECLKQHIELKIDGNELPVKCPFPKCLQEIDYYITRNLVSELHFAKYDTLIYMKLASTTEDRSETVIKCPNADCKMIFFLDKNEKYTHHICERCNMKFCVNGCQRAHEGFTCQQFREWLKENDEADKRFEVLVSKSGWAKCPKCKIAIERIADCPHMKCPMCKSQFCYLDSKIWGTCEHAK